MPVPQVDPFADLATLAHKISRKLAANPGDTQAREDLRYVVGKMQPAAAAAAGQDQAAIPRDVGPLGTFVQNAGNTASMGAGNRLAQVQTPDNPGGEMGKVIETSNAANPVSAKMGSAVGVVAPLLLGDWAAGWPALKALATVPRIGRVGLLRLLGATAESTPQAAPKAAEAAAQVVSEATGKEAKLLELARKTLFGKRTVLSTQDEALLAKIEKSLQPKVTTAMPESSAGINIPKPEMVNPFAPTAEEAALRAAPRAESEAARNAYNLIKAAGGSDAEATAAAQRAAGYAGGTSRGL